MMYSQNFACQPNQNEHRGRKKISNCGGQIVHISSSVVYDNLLLKNIVQQSDLLIIIVYSVTRQISRSRTGRDE